MHVIDTDAEAKDRQSCQSHTMGLHTNHRRNNYDPNNIK